MTKHDTYTELQIAQFQIAALKQAATAALDVMICIDEDLRLESDCEEPECSHCQPWRAMWSATEQLKRVLRETTK
jgi:hypothetical protein